jgi:hypothetical protein
MVLTIFSSLMVIGNRGIDPLNVKWLDGEFIYRINYGPATAQDVLTAREALRDHRDLWKRGRLTLLDRRIAFDLVNALFSVQGPSFSCDPAGKVEFIEGHHNEGEYPGFGRRLSPFEYNPFTAESEPLRAVEDFCITCVWSKGYSSTTLGSSTFDYETRPPMAAVAKDMIAMMNFFLEISEKPETQSQLPRTFEDWFELFLQGTKLYSIDSRSDNLPTEGFLWDLFTVMICLTRNPRERHGWKKQAKELRISDPHIPVYLLPNPANNPAKFHQFPGGTALGIERSPVIRLSDTHVSASQESAMLDEFDASYIHSGPYRLELTREVGAHLTLNNENKILVYCNPVLSYQKILHARPAVPGEEFSSYKTHKLGRSYLCNLPLKTRALGADLIAEEIRDTYSLLFSRNELSKSIARQLFSTVAYNLEVQFIDVIGRYDIPPKEPDKRKIWIINWKNRTFRNEGPTLNHFRHYRPRLLLLRKQMSEWKPRQKRDLLTPGYNDRFIFYSTIFALGFALIGLVGVISSIISTVLAWLTYDITKPS